jgi:hypothetical protein
MNTPKFNELLENLLSNLQEKKLSNISYVFNDVRAGQLDGKDRERRVWEIGFKEGEGLPSGDLLDLLSNRTGLKVSAILRILDKLESMGVVETSSEDEAEAPQEIESFDDEESVNPDEETEDYLRGDYEEEEDDYLMDSLQEAKKSYSAKEARKGKDIGKKGKMFSKIAKSAGKKYGSKEAGKKVAGAILKKLRGK